MVLELVIEVTALIVALAISAFVTLRTPKLTIPKEFELVEKEIEEWMQNPIIPSKGIEPATAESPTWAYSPLGKQAITIGQSAVSSFSVTSMLFQKDQIDKA